MARNQARSLAGGLGLLEGISTDDMRARRILSLAGAAAGVLQTGSLAVGLIGQGLTLARGRLTKHASKQVDRLLSNRGVEVEALFAPWVRFVIGQRESIVVAIDWIEFHADGKATLMLSLLGRHDHTTPLVWHTVETATLKNQRNAHEYRFVVLLAEIPPAAVKVRIVADRGFGDHKLCAMVAEELKFHFVIRFRRNVIVTAASGETRPAADRVGRGGPARTLRDATATEGQQPVATMVFVQDKGMAQPWCLAASTSGRQRLVVDQTLFPKLVHRVHVPRRGGYALRDGRRQRPRPLYATPRRTLTAQRPRHRPAHLPRHRWGIPRLRSRSQNRPPGAQLTR